MKKKTIAIFTSSRAEFGTMKPLIIELKKSKIFHVLIFAGGAHLSKKYGNTIEEINKNITITDKFDYIKNDDSEHGILKSLSLAITKISNIFKKYKFDYVLIFGDRYELISVMSNAIIYQKPILHIAGGDTTLGAIDETIRNIVSKSANLHFPASNDFANKIISFGEKKKNVFNVGMLGFDYLKKNILLEKKKIFKKYELDLNKDLVLFTLHPESINSKLDYGKIIKGIFKSLSMFDLQIICTSPNNAVNRNIIEKSIKEEIKKNKDYYYYKSLGIYNFHNLLNNSVFIIGNSSSGIMEAPFFKVPTINIGNRQKGRIRHKSIIDTSYKQEDITKAIKKVRSKAFLKGIKKMKYKLGKFNTSLKIRNIIEKYAKKN